MRNLFFLILLVLANHSIRFAEDTPSKSSSLIPKNGVLTNIERLQSRPDLSQDLKTRLQSGYEEVEKELSRIGDLNQKISNTEAILKSAPERLEALKKELDGEENSETSLRAYQKKTLKELEQVLPGMESDLTSQRKNLEILDASIQKELSERVKLPKLLAENRRKISEVEQSGMVELAKSTEEKELQEGLKEVLLRRLNLQTAAYEKEILSFDQRLEVLKLEKKVLESKLQKNELSVQGLRELLALKRQEEAELANLRAQKARREAANSHPLIKELTEEIASLARERSGPDGMTARLARLEEELRDIQELQSNLAKSNQELIQKVKVAGMTDAVGLLFRKQKNELPSLNQYKTRLTRLRVEIGKIQLKIIQLEEKTRSQSQVANLLEVFSARLSSTLSSQIRQDILLRADELLSTRTDYLEALLKDLNSSFLLMVDLDAGINQLINQAGGFSDYINENILWIRSGNALHQADQMDTFKALKWLVKPSHWLQVAVMLQSSIQSQPIVATIFTLILLILLVLRRTLVRRLQELGMRVRKSYVSSFRPTLESFAYTVILSLPMAILAFGFSFFLRDPIQQAEFIRPLSESLELMALYILGLRFLHFILVRDGLGECHFLWVQKGVMTFRRNLYWLSPVIISLSFVYNIIDKQAVDVFKDTLGRSCFVLGLLVLSVFFYLVLHPSREWLGDYWKKYPRSHMRRFGWIWFPLTFLMPMGLAFLSGMGYHYAAFQMMLRLQMSFVMLIGLLLFSSMLFRLMFNLRRSLAMERTEKKQSREESTEEIQLKELEAAAHQVEIPMIHLQTQRFLRGVSSILFLVSLFYIWVDVFPAFSIFDRVELWYDLQPVINEVSSIDGTTSVQVSEQTVAITLGDLILSLLVLLLTWTAVHNLPGLLEISILRKLSWEPAQSYAVVSVFRYSLVTIGLGVAFSTIGIGWQKVQWLAAAFTVGLGFGLQEIFANFVAGLIILFEQPIRLGDTVTIAGTSGTVSKIRIRATTITDFNRKELIIPNKEFITGQLVNWSLSDRILRLDLPLGVAYGSDVEKVTKALMEVAEEYEKIIKDPRPHIIFLNFGDSALEFEFRVFITDIEHFPVIRSEIMGRVYAKLCHYKVEIPFPQRDLHIKNLPIEIMHRPA